jgi:hypothetical protein
VSDTQLDAFKAWATADANEAEWVILRSDAAVLVAELERRTAALREIGTMTYSALSMTSEPIQRAPWPQPSLSERVTTVLGQGSSPSASPRSESDDVQDAA